MTSPWEDKPKVRKGRTYTNSIKEIVKVLEVGKGEKSGTAVWPYPGPRTRARLHSWPFGTKSELIGMRR